MVDSRCVSCLNARRSLEIRPIQLINMKRAQFLISAAAIAAIAWQTQPAVNASTILGTGTAALLGGDLTDPENDGSPDANTGYNATFSSSEEPGFGGAEAAFNVFDNQVGGGNMKWCCGDQNNFPTNPISISATFGIPYVLTHFTITSGNDSPDRDPRAWQIQGSSDGTNFTTIFNQPNTGASVWTARDQVIRFEGGGVDFATPAAYTTFRFITTATNLSTGARFQLNELEYFGVVPEPGVSMLAMAGLAAFGVSRRRRA